MIIVNLSGGLGNQMFQFAFANSVAKKYEFEVRFSTDFLSIHNGFELNEVFELNLNIVRSSDLFKILGWQAFKIIRKVLSRNKFSILRKKNFIVEPHYHFWSFYDKSIINNSYLHGYWQSHKYFFSRDEIISNFKFKKELSVDNLEVLQRIQSKNSVSIHVRRGDYQNFKSIHKVCEQDYYDIAIDKILSLFPDAFFYIFSDDINWVNNNFKKIANKKEVVSINFGINSVNDMRLMSLCNHNIISNSSFSWWAAYLNMNSTKTVIAPREWFTNQNNIQDLLPGDWIKV